MKRIFIPCSFFTLRLKVFQIKFVYLKTKIFSLPFYQKWIRKNVVYEIYKSKNVTK